MTRLPRPGGRAVALLALLAMPLGACAADDPKQADGPPAYCATSDGAEDLEFWRLVEQSCRVATDGDVQQARALRDVLEDLDTEQVAGFHRTFVRLNRALDTERVAAVADEACLPGAGLGDDLSTDFRSWVIAHGQTAYERVLADPEVLGDFPDLADGCGMGEPFGYAAFRVYADKAGREAALSRLPSLEPTAAPGA
ncbi:DUF4240 domain-containing protein [Nocardioides sp. GCM10027113]|uniref:DUF4240 domain-containing protein n=1 Tax=unclassified Nocardioides TaxID=2615069 RepID=UPI0036182ECE